MPVVLYRRVEDVPNVCSYFDCKTDNTTQSLIILRLRRPLQTFDFHPAIQSLYLYTDFLYLSRSYLTLIIKSLHYKLNYPLKTGKTGRKQCLRPVGYCVEVRYLIRRYPPTRCSLQARMCLWQPIGTLPCRGVWCGRSSKPRN